MILRLPIPNFFIFRHKVVRSVTSVHIIDKISRNTAAESQSVSAATEEQSASMEKIASSSEALAKLAQDLQEAVNHFRV